MDGLQDISNATFEAAKAATKPPPPPGFLAEAIEQEVEAELPEANGSTLDNLGVNLTGDAADSEEDSDLSDDDQQDDDDELEYKESPAPVSRELEQELRARDPERLNTRSPAAAAAPATPAAAAATPATPAAATATATATTPAAAAAAGPAARGGPLGAAAAKLMLWKDVPMSAAVFASGNVAFYLTCVKGYSFLTLGAYLALAALALAFVVLHASAFLNRLKLLPPRFNVREKGLLPAWRARAQVDRAFVAGTAEALVDEANGRLDAFFVLATEGPFGAQARCAAWLFFAAVLGKVFSAAALAYTAFLVAFGVPPFYLQNQAKVDALLARAGKHADAAYKSTAAKAAEHGRRASAASADFYKEKVEPHINKARAFVSRTPTPKKKDE